jgi:hypothetical protein
MEVVVLPGNCMATYKTARLKAAKLLTMTVINSCVCICSVMTKKGWANSERFKTSSVY